MFFFIINLQFISLFYVIKILLRERSPFKIENVKDCLTVPVLAAMNVANLHIDSQISMFKY